MREEDLKLTEFLLRCNTRLSIEDLFIGRLIPTQQNGYNKKTTLKLNPNFCTYRVYSVAIWKILQQ